jgi:mono/diheme cytochrome c family protein
MGPSEKLLRNIVLIGLAASIAAGCDDEQFKTAEGAAVSGEGCDAVEQVISGNCASCHSGAGAAGGLDLATDWYTAVIDGGYVVPGDSAGSVLFQRMSSTTSPMPPAGNIAAENQAIVSDWIDAGAEACSTAADGATDGGADGGVNTDGASLYSSGCAGCHGADGDSGYAPNLTEEVPGEDLEDIVEVVMFGKDTMPAVYPDEVQAAAVAQYVLDTFGG